MNITKKDIVRKINKETQISSMASKSFLDKFLDIIKCESYKNNKILKLNGFGSFKLKFTPKRVGRNPNTQDSYIIKERNKLTFTTSFKIRKFIN